MLSYKSSSLSSMSIMGADCTALHAHTRSALKRHKIIVWRTMSLCVAIEYVGACNNLHHNSQMEQFDWSEMTYYNYNHLFFVLQLSVHMHILSQYT